MKLVKLDARHTGFGEFKHYASFVMSEFPKFLEIREWCWNQWGPSYELQYWNKGPGLVPWCWLTQDYGLRIYLRSEKELQWFTLKWL